MILNGRIFPPRFGGYGTRWQTNRTFMPPDSRATHPLPHSAHPHRGTCGTRFPDSPGRADDRSDPPADAHVGAPPRRPPAGSAVHGARGSILTTSGAEAAQARI